MSTASNRLVILEPGELLGVRPGDTITLGVRYEDPEGAPISGARIEFLMAAEAAAGEDTAGSTLSADEGVTDESGVARVDLAAGGASGTFRVQVMAANATPVTFYVGISEAGFVTLVIRPEHAGAREAESFTRVEVRLYRPGELRCVDFDPDAPPPSLFPPRSMASFGGDVRYQNLLADEPYTIVAWAESVAGGTALAAGCVDVGASQVPTGTVRTEVVVADRDAQLPSSLELSSTFDLAPVASVIESTAGLPWSTLSCAEGPGQLLVDCAIDALGDDGTLDCRLDGPTTSSTALAIAAARGTPDAQGCRPSMIGGGTTSADALVASAVTSAAFPVGTELQTLLALRAELLDSVTVRSELAPLSADFATHQLTEVTVTLGGQPYTVVLTDTTRPVLEATVSLARAEDGELLLGDHGFTFRYGTFAAGAFRARALAPHGLDTRASDLGTALVDALYHAGSAKSACDALSHIVCTAAGLQTDCLDIECAAAKPVLDQRLTEWWRLLDGPGLDLTLSGTSPLYDFDDDLAVDALGTDAQQTRTGGWSAGFVLDDGSAISTVGGFGSTQTVVP